MNRKTCLFCAVWLVILVQNIWAQGYTIGKDDVLEISFWQDNGLNVTARVGADGQIALPIGGSVTAAGLTVEQLREAVVERISIYNRRITNCSIKVVEYGSRKIYVMGHVRSPQKYTFEVIPNLWDIISEAGGPLETANLTNVLIIRSTPGGEPQTITVDVAEAMRNRNLQSLPKVEPGDNIYIPAAVGNVTSSGIQSMQSQQNVLFVYGAVASSGVITFNKELNLLEALITSGGPTAEAKLNEVRVIRKNGAYSSVTIVNVEKYTEESSPSFFMVKAGDTIYVPRRKTVRDSVAWDFFMIFAGAALSGLAFSWIGSR